MTSADGRREDEDAWAQAVAEDAALQAAEARQREHGAGTAEPVPDDRGEGDRRPGDRSADEDPFGGGSLGAGEQYLGPELGPLVDEVRRFATTVGEKMQEASRTLGYLGESLGRGGVDQVAAPLREKHPEVYRHLAAAGGELLAAYRAAVSGHERRWTSDKPSSSEHIDLD